MKKKTKPRHQIYPWNKWFSRELPVVLKQGRDFNGDIRIMTQQVRNAAARRGLKASLNMTDTQIRILSLEGIGYTGER